MASTPLLLLALLSLVNAHTSITGFIVDGQSTMECVRPTYPGYVPETKLGAQWPIQQSNLLENGIESQNYTCGFMPFAGRPARTKCSVRAGSQVAVSYYHGAGSTEDPVLDQYIHRSHKGPFFAYMAKSETGTGNVWFKIFQEGKLTEPIGSPDWQTNFDSVKWASPDTLLKNKGRMIFTIPSDITAGNYLLRTEILAMHDISARGSQPYVHCVELTVTGGGSIDPPGVPIPGTVKQSDAGLSTQYKIYNDFAKPYPFMGPAVYQPGSIKTTAPQTSAAPTSRATSQPVTSAAPTSQAATSRQTSTPIPATSVAPPVADIHAIVTISLPIAPSKVNLDSFVYEITQVLDIPYSAITDISILLDQSTESPAKTVIRFTITNVVDTDGTRVNPILTGTKLKELSASKSPILSNSVMLSGIEVLDVQDTEASGSSDNGAFVGSAGFVIMIAVIGGVLLVAIVVSLTIVLVKRKRSNGGFF